MPNVWIHVSILEYPKKKDSIAYPNPTTPNPKPIEKKEIFNLKSVGLPVFLNPIYANIPNTSPTTKPRRLSAASSTNSNYAQCNLKLIKYCSRFISTNHQGSLR